MSSEPPPKPIGPGNHDRAWNDPPLFSVAVNTTAKAPTRKLTGRVGFPIDTSSTGRSSITSGNSVPIMLVPGGGPPQVGFIPQVPSVTSNDSLNTDNETKTLQSEIVTIPS